MEQRINIDEIHKQLKSKLKSIGYKNYQVKEGEESTLLVYIDDRLICSAIYATTLGNKELSDLIKETLEPCE